MSIATHKSGGPEVAVRPERISRGRGVVPAEQVETNVPDEERLAAGFSAGDRQAAEILLERFAPHVERLVQRLLGWPGDVDDVVQDVFVAALTARTQFRGQCRPETWLTRIAVNQCRAHLRKRWVRRRLFGAWADRHHTPAEAAPADHQPTIDEHAAKVREAIGRLPAKYREVVVLFYLEEMSAAEAADVLTVRRGTVEVRLSRARKQLAELLTPMELD